MVKSGGSPANQTGRNCRLHARPHHSNAVDNVAAQNLAGSMFSMLGAPLAEFADDQASLSVSLSASPQLLLCFSPARINTMFGIVQNGAKQITCLADKI